MWRERLDAFCERGIHVLMVGLLMFGTYRSGGGDGKAQVRIQPCSDPSAGAVCGYIAALINPTGPDGKVVPPEDATDWRNSDPSLRGRKVVLVAWSTY